MRLCPEGLDFSIHFDRSWSIQTGLARALVPRMPLPGLAQGFGNMLKRFMTTLIIAAIFSLFVSHVVVTPSYAHDYTVRGLTIDHPWARPTPGGSKIAAVYLKLVNKSDEADTLVSARSSVGTKIEIHETTFVDDIAKMRRLDNGVPVAANKTVALEPSGLHLMVLGLTRSLKVGDRIPLTLTFKNRGEVNVKINIETAPAEKKPAHHHH